MIKLEQVEKLRQHANISYEEARTALEKADGDILQALIDLENEGKVKAPDGCGKYVSVPPSADDFKESKQTSESQDTKSKRTAESGFKSVCADFSKFVGKIFHKGNVNAFIVERHKEEIMHLPVTVLVILLIVAFWIVVPLLAVGLFFGFRYSFEGPDLGTEKVNNAMDSVSKAAEEIKKDINK